MLIYLDSEHCCTCYLNMNIIQIYLDMNLDQNVLLKKIMDFAKL